MEWFIFVGICGTMWAWYALSHIYSKQEEGFNTLSEFLIIFANALFFPIGAISGWILKIVIASDEEGIFFDFAVIKNHTIVKRK